VRQRLKGRFRLEIDALASAIPPAGEYDVVHAHWTYEFAAAALDRDANSLITAHDSPWTVLRYYRQLYRVFRLGMAWRVARRGRHLTVVSPWLAERWNRQMRYSGTIAVIPNMAPSPPSGMSRAPVRNSFISIGDSGRNKNMVSLLEAFAILRTRVPDATLQLVGPGLDETGTFRTSWNGPGDGVTFAGALDREALWQALMVSAVLVHPSFHEAQGVALLEGMRAGLPVVAGRRSGAAAWTLGEGAAGTLTDITDPVALAAAMESVMLKPDPAKLRAAADLIESRYSPGAVVSAYEAEYLAILRAGGVRGG
jgi:glycosyltransferase involved in cell wall biosynthesis